MIRFMTDARLDRLAQAVTSPGVNHDEMVSKIKSKSNYFTMAAGPEHGDVDNAFRSGYVLGSMRDPGYFTTWHNIYVVDGLLDESPSRSRKRMYLYFYNRPKREIARILCTLVRERRLADVVTS